MSTTRSTRAASYQYRAQIVRVVDGDTVIADVDLGFNCWVREQSFRICGINAREKDEPGGAAAARNLAQILTPGTAVTLISVKPDKFGGRYDAYLRLGDGSDVSATLIETQWAAAWSGRGEKPVPPWPRTIP